MLDLYLIRHAESKMNTHRELIGGRSNDTPLYGKGVYQACLLGKRLFNEHVAFDNIYSSPAKRALDTAAIVGRQLGYSIERVITSPELLELDQGEWEGKPRVDIYTPEVLARINSDNWNFRPPNGESQRAVEERMLKFVNEELISADSERKVVGIFTHGMSIKCLLRGILEFTPKITYKIAINNTAITRLLYSGNGWHVITVNDTAHLLGFTPETH